jgi:hypothetical protein
MCIEEGKAGTGKTVVKVEAFTSIMCLTRTGSAIGAAIEGITIGGPRLTGPFFEAQ